MRQGSRRSLSSAVALLPTTAIRRVELRKGRSDADFGFVLTGERPAVFSAVQPVGLAARAGVRMGDVLLAVNGCNVDETAHEDIVSMVERSGGTVVLLVTEDEIYRLGLSFAGPQATLNEVPVEELAPSPELYRAPSISSSRSSGSHKHYELSTADGSIGAFRDYDRNTAVPISPRSPQASCTSLSSSSSQGYLNSTEIETVSPTRVAVTRDRPQSEIRISSPSLDRCTSSSNSLQTGRIPQRLSKKRDAGVRPLKSFSKKQSHSDGSLDRVAQSTYTHSKQVSEGLWSGSDFRVYVTYCGNFHLGAEDLTNFLVRRRLVLESTTFIRQLEQQSYSAQLQLLAGGVSLRVDDGKHPLVWWPSRTLALAWVDPTDESFFSVIRRTPSAGALNTSTDFRAILNIFRTRCADVDSETACGSSNPAVVAVHSRSTEATGHADVCSNVEGTNICRAGHGYRAKDIVQRMKELYHGRPDFLAPSGRCKDTTSERTELTEEIESPEAKDPTVDSVRLVGEDGDINLRGLELLTSARPEDLCRLGSRSSLSIAESQVSSNRNELPLRPEVERESPTCTPVYFDWTSRPTHATASVPIDFSDTLFSFTDKPLWVRDRGLRKTDAQMDKERWPGLLRRQSSVGDLNVNSELISQGGGENRDGSLVASHENLSQSASQYSSHADNSNVPEDCLGRVAKWATNMKHLLEDPLGLQLFKEALEKWYCAENLRFWLAVEDHRRLSDSVELAKSAGKIYDDFLANSACQQVNLDSVVYKAVEDGLDNPSAELFDRAQRDVFRLMKTDSFPKFIRSNQYKDMVVRELAGEVFDCRLDTPGVGKSKSRRLFSFLRTSAKKKTPEILSNQKGTPKKAMTLPPHSTSPTGSELSCSSNASSTMRTPEIDGRGKSIRKSGSPGNGQLYHSASTEDVIIAPESSLMRSPLHTEGLAQACKGGDMLLRLTVPDRLSRVVLVKAMSSIADVITPVCERCNVTLDQVEVFERNDQQVETPVDLLGIVGNLSTQELIIRQRGMIHVILPDGNSTQIQPKPQHTLANSLDQVLSRYGLTTADVAVSITDQKDIGQKVNLSNSSVAFVYRTVVIELNASSLQRGRANSETGSLLSTNSYSSGSPSPSPRSRHKRAGSFRSPFAKRKALRKTESRTADALLELDELKRTRNTTISLAIGHTSTLPRNFRSPERIPPPSDASPSLPIRRGSVLKESVPQVDEDADGLLDILDRMQSNRLDGQRFMLNHGDAPAEAPLRMAISVTTLRSPVRAVGNYVYSKSCSQLANLSLPSSPGEGEAADVKVPTEIPENDDSEDAEQQSYGLPRPCSFSPRHEAPREALDEIHRAAATPSPDPSQSHLSQQMATVLLESDSGFRGSSSSLTSASTPPSVRVPAIGSKLHAAHLQAQSNKLSQSNPDLVTASQKPDRACFTPDPANLHGVQKRSNDDALQLGRQQTTQRTRGKPTLVHAV